MAQKPYQLHRWQAPDARGFALTKRVRLSNMPPVAILVGGMPAW
jgi:hypothetical protein